MTRRSGLEAPPSIFDEALRSLGGMDGVTPPRSFRDYAKAGGVTLTRATPEYISVDSYGRLPATLRQASAMVFRLGEADGTGTQFSIVQVAGCLRDFFVFDDELFGAADVETYLPEASARTLFPFSLVDPSAETNVVNLAFASGVLAEALELDQPPTIPATGRGRYSFSFRPHSSLDAVLHHRLGQVEVDAMFVGRRHGRQCLFVLEAKVSGSAGSLALHKLAYPCLAFRAVVPEDLPVVPVYLRASRSEEGMTFNLAVFDAIPQGELVMNTMRTNAVRRLKIPGRSF
jgi:hypothetical protein